MAWFDGTPRDSPTAVGSSISWAVTGRYALNSADLEGDDFDIGVSAALSRRFGHFYAYLTLGYAWYGSESFRAIELVDTQASVLAAGEWRFKARQSLVVQWLWSEAVVEDLGPFSEPSNEVTIGWKWEVVQAGVLEVGLIENIITFDNSPDFGVHFAWTQRL